MNPITGRVLLSLALIGAGFVGVAAALNQAPRSIVAPPEKAVAVKKPVQQAPSRSSEIATQLDQSMAGQFLKQMTGQADAKVEESKSAIGNFIKQKTDEQRDYLKQVVVEALQETVSGEVKKQTDSLKAEFKGVKLTPDQSTQIQQARREMQSEIVKEIQTNPDLIKQIQAGKADQNLAQPLKNYSQVVTSVLTPQQKEQWQKNFNVLKALN
jgi:Spy/CpxP family protein refolding chaperone